MSSLAEEEPRAAAENDPSLAKRVLGVGMVTSTPAVAKLALRYNQIFTPKLTPQEADARLLRRVLRDGIRHRRAR